MADSLAVRHRPRRFADVAGQRHVSAVLRSAAARQQPPQQILLAGGSGLGKTTLARIFAAALFCEDRAENGDACGVCESCRDVTGAGTFHPDVIELDAASNGGKDEVRDIAARASLTPLRAPWKIYIIDEAHGLTGPGGQAFLKLLEEPPTHTIFVLATTDPDKLPTAVRGRCTICEVLPPTGEETLANLRRIAELEGWAVDDEALEAVLAATDPALGMRGTVMTLEKLAGPLSAGDELTGDDLEALLGTVAPSRLAALTAAIVAGDRPAALLALTEQSRRVGSSHLRRQLTAWARAQVVDAARVRAGFEAAFHRYELLAEAGNHDGALEVAVTRMAAPHLDDSLQAARALLEQTHAALAQFPRDTPAHAPSPAPSPAHAPEPPPAAAPVTPLASAVRPVAPAAEEVPGTDAPAGADGVPVDLRDPDLVAVLNTVGRASARAASTLRRCTFTRTVDGGMRGSVPAGLEDKVIETGLREVLAALTGQDALPVGVTLD